MLKKIPDTIRTIYADRRHLFENHTMSLWDSVGDTPPNGMGRMFSATHVRPTLTQETIRRYIRANRREINLW